MLFGGERGLTRSGARALRPPWGWRPEWFRFAAALATGDLDGDRYDDLALGAPGWRAESVASNATVTTIFRDPFQP